MRIFDTTPDEIINIEDNDLPDAMVMHDSLNQYTIQASQGHKKATQRDKT
jgi:hypothetical protein